MTMPISSGGGAVPVGDVATPSTATGMASLLQPTTFLNLLVDELKYQDPLDPTSSSSFMDQIAQLSQVEQLQTVSTSQQISEAAALIGKTVTGADSAGATITGLVTGVTDGANGPTLNINGDYMSLASVQQISSSPSPSPSTGTSTGTSGGSTTATTSTSSPTA